MRALTFVNGWHPLWTPTVLSQWTVVPGGWSIGVEFTFYAAFPLIATLIRSLPAALLFFVLSVALGCVANTLAYPDLAASYGAFSAGNFLYFWFPNQLPIFALGTVLYLTIEHMASKRTSPGATLIMRWRYSIIAVSVVAMYALTELHLPTRLWLDPPAPFPILIMVSIAFMMVTLVIALDPDNLLVNRAICALGKVSFSVYILHFFVVRKLPLLLPSLFDTHATGVPAILACFALGIVTVPLTFGLSRVTFRFIEAPMIRIGRRAPPHGAAITATRLPEPG